MKKSAIVLAIITSLYISSYILLRQNYIKYDEFDGCLPNKCHSVVFPQNKIFLTFSPLILMDKFINKTEIYIENW